MDVSSSYDDKAAAKSTSLQTPAHIGDNVVMSLPKKVESDTVGTLLVYQPTCLDHHNDTHQENRERLGVLCGPEGVLHKDRFKDLQWANLNELKPARLNDMLRVHSFEYIQHLERVCGLLPEQDEAYSVGRLYDENKDLSYSDWINVRLHAGGTATYRKGDSYFCVSYDVTMCAFLFTCAACDGEKNSRRKRKSATL
jgi:acetoin utilization deacetylase AcuC-like enzyme